MLQSIVFECLPVVVICRFQVFCSCWTSRKCHYSLRRALSEPSTMPFTTLSSMSISRTILHICFKDAWQYHHGWDLAMWTCFTHVQELHLLANIHLCMWADDGNLARMSRIRALTKLYSSLIYFKNKASKWTKDMGNICGSLRGKICSSKKAE